MTRLLCSFALWAESSTGNAIVSFVGVVGAVALLGGRYFL